MLFNICLASCLLASIYLRGVLLNISFEYDELFTAVTTDPFAPFGWLYSHYLIIDVHPPLYNALLWIWNHFVPYGPELWLRLPSLLLGIGALAVAWVLFPRYLGKTARKLFVALLACNLYTLFYSQHARSYMLMLLLAVPVTFLFVNMQRQLTKQRTLTARQWITFGGLCLLLCWSHYFGALLAGICSLRLIVKAGKSPANLKPAIWTGVSVGLCFLPWLIPNIMEQLAFERFSGNWWGNQTQWGSVPWTLLRLFLPNTVAILTMGSLLMGSGVWWYWQWKKTGHVACLPMIKVLSEIWVVALLVITVVSLKTFLFFGRYFISLFPAAYLGISIWLAPVVRRYWPAKIVFVGFLVINLFLFSRAYPELKVTPKFPIRMLSQIYRDFYPGKEMFVIAAEGFPPSAMPAMYGFYVNRVYGLAVPVTELFTLDESARNEVLKRKDNAFIWMPNCTTDKLQKVADKWHRSLGVYGHLPDTCILKIS